MKRLIIAIVCLLSIVFQLPAVAAPTTIETADHFLSGKIACYVEPITQRPIMYFYIQQEAPNGNPIESEEDITLPVSTEVTFVRGSISLYALSGSQIYDTAGFTLYPFKNPDGNPVAKGSILASRGWQGPVRTTGGIDYMRPFVWWYGVGAVFVGSKPIPPATGMRLNGIAQWYDGLLNRNGASRIVAKGTNVAPTTLCSTERWERDTVFNDAATVRREVEALILGFSEPWKTITKPLVPVPGAPPSRPWGTAVPANPNPGIAPAVPVP